MNIAAHVKNNASIFGEKIAISYLNKQYTYKQVWSLIMGLSDILISKGIKKGDHIGLAMKDHPLHLIAHFSIAAIGAIIVPIDHRWTEKEKERASLIFKVKLLIMDQGHISNVNTISLTESDIRENIHPNTEIDLNYNQDLLISLSSGTTGKPKGAILTHNNLYQRFVSQQKTIGFNSEDSFGLLTPLFFGAGRSFAMCMLVIGGRAVIAPPPHKPHEIVEILNSNDINATFLPPTLLRRLLPMALISKPLLGALEHLIYSGEPLHSEEALACFEKLSPKLTGYYASSEGGGISVIKPLEIENYSETVGRAIYQTDIKIVDDENHEVDLGVVGKLKYKGPGVATNFLDDKGDKFSTERDDGWFFPGDLAKKLPSGHIQLIGRSNDLIIRGGINIYPNEIESILINDPGIREVAVIGHKNSEFGETIIAFIDSNSEFELKKCLDFCKNNLAPYKIPTKFIQLDYLPKKESGKIDKQRLKKSLEKL